MICSISFIGTGRIYDLGGRIVTGSSDRSLLDKDRLTSRALYAGGKTVLGTGRILSLKDNVIKMSKCIDLVIYVAVTACGTGMCCLTGSITGSLNYVVNVAVTVCLTLGGLTDITGLRLCTGCFCPIVTGSFTVGESAASASRRYCTRGQRKVVTKCLTPSLLTYSTGLRLGTGSLNESVRESTGNLFTAKGASLSRFTCGIDPFVYALFFLNRGLFTTADDATDHVTGRECEQKDH
jgi:hypothetical protein